MEQTKFYNMITSGSGSTSDDFDFMFRFRIDGVTNKVDFRKWDTKTIYGDLANRFSCYQMSLETLAEVVKGMKNTIDLGGFYNALLMGQLSDEEYEKISDEFAYEPRPIEVNLLTEKIKIIQKYTQINFSSSELQDYFRCDAESVNNALISLSHEIDYKAE